MAVTPSSRLGLTRWSAGGDPFTRAQLDADHAILDKLAHVLNRVVATTTVVNTVTESNLYSLVIPGGSLAGTDNLRLILAGDYLNNTGGSKNLTMRVKFGATTVAATTAVGLAASATRRKWRMTLLILMNGTTEERFGGDLLIGSGVAAEIDGLGTNHGPIYGLAAENTATDKTLAVTAQHGTADAALDIRVHAALLEAMRL